jgi:hypothetical protein
VYRVKPLSCDNKGAKPEEENQYANRQGGEKSLAHLL